MSQGKKLDCVVVPQKQPLVELVDENISLNRKNRFLWVGLIGLSALSALSVNSCRKNTKALMQANSENVELKEMVSYFRQDAAHLALENQRLKKYERFVDSISSFYPDTVIDGKNAKEEGEMRRQKIEDQKKWNNACKILGIEPAVLSRLKEME